MLFYQLCLMTVVTREVVGVRIYYARERRLLLRLTPLSYLAFFVPTEPTLTNRNAIKKLWVDVCTYVYVWAHTHKQGLTDDGRTRKASSMKLYYAWVPFIYVYICSYRSATKLSCCCCCCCCCSFYGSLLARFLVWCRRAKCDRLLLRNEPPTTTTITTTTTTAKLLDSVNSAEVYVRIRTYTDKRERDDWN